MLCVVISLEITAVEFDCKFRHNYKFHLKKVYECYVKNITDKTDSFSVTGTHLEGKRNVDVESLCLFNIETKKIPSGISKIFPNLTGLYWWYAKLPEISANDLKQFPNLVVIDLLKNNIKTLEGGIFHHTLNLTVVNIDRNPLKRVDDYLLDGLNLLRNASFLSSRCINFVATNQSSLIELKQKISENCQKSKASKLIGVWLIFLVYLLIVLLY